MQAAYGEEWNWPKGQDEVGLEDYREDENDPFSPVQQCQVACVGYCSKRLKRY